MGRGLLAPVRAARSSRAVAVGYPGMTYHRGMMVVLGGIGVIVGVVCLFLGLANWRRRQRILATPTSSIAQAPGHGLVEIKGRMSPSERGVFQAPFSGRQAIWCRVTVQELRRSGKSSHWHTLIREIDGRDFYVDDGSGQYARVEPAGANVVLQAMNVASSGTFNDASAHLEQFLLARGHKSTSWLGFNKSMRYQEELLVPGDTLYALGPSRRVPGPPVRDGYRMTPSNLLVMSTGIGPEAELILTNQTEDQLVGKLARGFYAGLAITAVSLLIGTAGVVQVLLR